MGVGVGVGGAGVGGGWVLGEGDSVMVCGQG